MEPVSAGEDAEIVIVSTSTNVGLQVLGSTSSGLGVFADLVATESIARREGKSDHKIAALAETLAATDPVEALPNAIGAALVELSDIEPSRITAVRPDQLAAALDSAGTATVIVIAVEAQLSPLLEMVEVRGEISVIDRSQPDDPAYSTLAVSQSHIEAFAWAETYSSGPKAEDLQKSIDYWKAGRESELARKVEHEYDAAARLVAACLNDVLNPRPGRQTTKVTHESLTGWGFKTGLNAYYLSEYDTEEREILRRLPQPWQYPKLAYNVMFSKPKGQLVQHIDSRH